MFKGSTTFNMVNLTQNQLVSVVIPSIDRNILMEAVDSVLRQTYKDFEILVIDDSKTQSIEIDIPNLRTLRTGGQKGPSAARNLGIQNSTGKYIAFLDDDDLWHPKKLEIQIKKMVEMNISVTLSRSKVGKYNFRPRRNNCLKRETQILHHLYSKPHIMRSPGYLPMSTVLLLKSEAEGVKFDSTLMERENLDWLVRLQEKGCKIVQIPKTLATTRYHKSDSLARMNFDIEFAWFRKLSVINNIYAMNFAIESGRNFLRIGKYYEAKRMYSKIEKSRSVKFWLINKLINLQISRFHKYMSEND